MPRLTPDQRQERERRKEERLKQLASVLDVLCEQDATDFRDVDGLFVWGVIRADYQSDIERVRDLQRLPPTEERDKDPRCSWETLQLTYGLPLEAVHASVAYGRLPRKLEPEARFKVDRSGRIDSLIIYNPSAAIRGRDIARLARQFVDMSTVPVYGQSLQTIGIMIRFPLPESEGARPVMEITIPLPLPSEGFIASQVDGILKERSERLKSFPDAAIGKQSPEITTTLLTWLIGLLLNVGYKYREAERLAQELAERALPGYAFTGMNQGYFRDRRKRIVARLPEAEEFLKQRR